MNALLHISDIEPKLAEPGFWTQKRLGILKAIYETYKSEKVIRLNDLSSINNRIIGRGRKLNNDYIRECNYVLGKLEEIGWDVKYLTITLKKPRPSILPANKDDLILFETLLDKRNTFWLMGSERISSLYDLLEILIIECSIGLCLSGEQLSEVISTLMGQSNSELVKRKVHVKAPDNCYISLPLSARIRVLCSAIIRLQNNNTEVKLNSPDMPLAKKNVLDAASNYAAYRSIEPVIADQLNSPLLPLSPPRAEDAFKFGISEKQTQNYPRIIHRAKLTSEQQQLKSRETNYIPASPISIIPELPIIDAAIASLRRAQRELRREKREFGVYKNGIVEQDISECIFSKVKPRFIEYLRLVCKESSWLPDEKQKNYEWISELENTITGLDLAVEWARYQLEIKRNTCDTLFNHFSSLFYSGFLQYEGCFDLKQWDEEDTEILISDFILGRDLSPGTVSRTQTDLRQLVHFARRDLDLFKEVDFAGLHEKHLILTTRNHTVGLCEFDLIIKEVLKSYDEEKESYAAVMCLAFYGGLRAGEIAQLGLNDIVYDTHEMVIYLPAFKTPSGRRSVPLHLLAPPRVLKIIQSVIETRVRDYRVFLRKSQESVKNIYSNSPRLFATDISFNKNSSHLVVQNTRLLLQRIVGAGADLHLLRHSFASHLFLRWYCCRHSDLIQSLSDRPHWQFSKDGIAALRFFFGEEPSKPLPFDHSNAMIHIIKLMGHRNTDTFFRVYVHSFEVVAQHALRKFHDIDDQLILPGRSLSRLLPNMRSPTSRAKVKDRSIAGVVRDVAFLKATEEQD